MKRVVLAVPDPWNYFDKFPGYSMAIINPAGSEERKQYLLDKLDWSLMITPQGEQHRDGCDYGNEYLVLYTSGTTGDSKFFGYTKSQVRHVIDNFASSYNLNSNDRLLSVMPMWHGHGHLLNLTAKHVGMETRYAQVSELKNQIDFSPTWVSAIPDMLKLMARTQKFTDLRFVRSASVALPTQVYNTLNETFNVPIVEAFGMTETCSHCFTNPLNGEQRIGTVGLPSGVDARIVAGQLEIKGPSVCKTGWFATGDLADQDSQGYYRIIGRIADRINVRGYKIDPLSVENQLYNTLPDLSQVAVFGQDHLMCIYTGSVTEQQVRQAIINIDQHCSPRMVKQVDTIPVNPANKVSRSMLLELYK